MTQSEKKLALQKKVDFLKLLIFEFMTFVKNQKEDDKEAPAKADAKFKDLNTQWRRVCQSKDCAYMHLRNNAFYTNVFKLMKSTNKAIAKKTVTENSSDG